MFINIKISKNMITVILIIALALSVFSSIRAVSSVTSQAEAEPLTLPIIMYHGLLDKPDRENDYMIDVQYFEEDLKYLRQNGFHTVLTEEVIQYFEKGEPLPENPIMLTFDDGYYNNYLYAYPLLKKYGFKAVISPIGITADNEEIAENQGERRKSPFYTQCSWAELKEMQDSGVFEIQNHTYNLHKIGERKGAAAISGESEKAYETLLKADLNLFSKKMKEHLGKKPTAFVYPFGAKSETTLDIVKSLGYRAVFDCEEKINIIYHSDQLYSLHRFLRPNHLSSKDFFVNTLGIG